VAQNASVAIEKELYIVDTIEIKDPIVVRFIENKNTHFYQIQTALISKERLDSMYKGDTSFVNFVCVRGGYLFFQPAEFSCLVNNLLFNKPALKASLFYTKLQTHLRKAEKDKIFVPIDKNVNKLKEYMGWEYREIYHRKFLLCLAKGSAINSCQGLDEIKIRNMDNVYFKVLCPISWE
jgi:hypothetical protein